MQYENILQITILHVNMWGVVVFLLFFFCIPMHYYNHFVTSSAIYLAQMVGGIPVLLFPTAEFISKAPLYNS